MRTGGQKILGQFKRRDRLLTLYGRKVGEKLIQRVSCGQVVKEVLHRHARTPKEGVPPRISGSTCTTLSSLAMASSLHRDAGGR